MEIHIGRYGGLKGGGICGLGHDFGSVSNSGSGCANCQHIVLLGGGCGLNRILDDICGVNEVATGQQLCEKLLNGHNRGCHGISISRGIHGCFRSCSENG